MFQGCWIFSDYPRLQESIEQKLTQGREWLEEVFSAVFAQLDSMLVLISGVC